MRPVKTSLVVMLVAACSSSPSWKARVPVDKEKVTQEGLIEVTALGSDPVAKVPKARLHALFTTTTLAAGVAPDCVDTIDDRCVTTYCELPLPDAGAPDSGAVVRDSAGRIDLAAATFDGGVIGFVSTTAHTQDFYVMRPVAEPDVWVVSAVGDVVPAIDKELLFAMAPIEVTEPTCDEKNECGYLRLDRDFEVAWAGEGTGHVKVKLDTRTDGDEFTATVSVACTYRAGDHKAVVPESVLRRFDASTATLSIEAGRTTKFSAGAYRVTFTNRVPALSGTVTLIPP